MAKLKGPLFSLGASGAIGKAIVYFGWKGLDVAREFVVPANPKSTWQRIVRGWFANAVDEVHTAQAHPDYPLGSDDQTAYALLGSLQPTPRTWFNVIVGQWVYRRFRGKYPAVFKNGSSVSGDTTLNIAIHSDDIATAKITDGNFHWGVSKSNLINTEPGVFNLPLHGCSAALTGLANNIKYFWQFRPTVDALYADARSGIYYGTPKAA